MIDHPEEFSNQSIVSKLSSVDIIPPLPTAKSSPAPIVPISKPSLTTATLPSETTPNVAPPPQPTPTKTLIQVFEQSGLDISESCRQLIEIIDKSLSSVLVRETYKSVLDDLESRLDYEVTGEEEAEDE